ncbi:MAG: hypothetical protein ACQESR_09525 [Planctomycetota bacterium]
MESCLTQAVLPLVGLAAEKVIRDRYIKQRSHGLFLTEIAGRSGPVTVTMI